MRGNIKLITNNTPRLRSKITERLLRVQGEDDGLCLADDAIKRESVCVEKETVKQELSDKTFLPP